MRILFTPAGDTDPVRGFHDGAMLHILRHYPVDKVIIFLTKEMEDKENSFGCYSRGIADVAGDCPVEIIRSHITDPQNFEALGVMLEEFDAAYKKYPEAEWLLNVSSGTPQIKTVMTMLALDYARATAIHVDSPERSSNRRNHPCESAEELVEMLECNEDNDLSAPNRCSEPPLSILRRHGLKLQIESLVDNYDYDGALQIVKANRNLFTKTTFSLLQHGVYRVGLRPRDANKEISQYNGKALIAQVRDFSEYFQIMELQQRKGQLADFIIKLSPILTKLAWMYLEKVSGFSISECCRLKDGSYHLDRYLFEQKYPDVLYFIEGQFNGKALRNDPFYFQIAVFICQYFEQNALKENKTHKTITHIFIKMRHVERSARNALAHTITNMTEEKLIRLQKLEQLRDMNQLYRWEKLPPKRQQEILDSMDYKGLSSKEIVQLLHQAAKLIQGQDVPWTYDYLNDCIKDSMDEIPK